ncbi:MAG: hypothetical protein IJ615_00465 [Bacteroidaceae bacterium]|nr:hypothetical protein [Bacteroidaceae bacterium]
MSPFGKRRSKGTKEEGVIINDNRLRLSGAKNRLHLSGAKNRLRLSVQFVVKS